MLNNAESKPKAGDIKKQEQHPLADTIAWNQLLLNGPSGGKNYFPASCANLKLLPKEA